MDEDIVCLITPPIKPRQLSVCMNENGVVLARESTKLNKGEVCCQEDIEDLCQVTSSRVHGELARKHWIYSAES